MWSKTWCRLLFINKMIFIVIKIILFLEKLKPIRYCFEPDFKNVQMVYEGRSQGSGLTTSAR